MESSETTGKFDGPTGSIAWRRLGSGPPLLLINGYAATKDDWDPGFLAALARSATVVCPDNRGVGESDPEPGELSVGSMAADMAALLDDLGWETADVAGWSMGGFVAQQLAADVPGSRRTTRSARHRPGRRRRRCTRRARCSAD